MYLIPIFILPTLLQFSGSEFSRQFFPEGPWRLLASTGRASASSRERRLTFLFAPTAQTFLSGFLSRMYPDRKDGTRVGLVGRKGKPRAGNISTPGGTAEAGERQPGKTLSI